MHRLGELFLRLSSLYLVLFSGRKLSLFTSPYHDGVDQALQVPGVLGILHHLAELRLVELLLDDGSAEVNVCDGEDLPRTVTGDTDDLIADLSLTFETNDGPVHALSNVSLGIEKGDFVSLIGPSGCGKTTLLRVIADLEHPTGGRVSIHGMTPEEARLKRAYGYVFQAPALYP